MPFLEEIRLTNLLSFGPETPALRLRPLNVLIGPNGSGKSNFIEAISFLRSAPRDLAEEVRDSGGIMDWLWLRTPRLLAGLDVVVAPPSMGQPPIRHSLTFTESGGRFDLVSEEIGDSIGGRDSRQPVAYFTSGQPPVIRVDGEQRELFDFHPNNSVIAQRRDPQLYPEITYLAERYSKVKIYRDWAFGRTSPLRRPQRADDRNDYLKESLDNLGLVLNRLRRTPAIKQNLLERLAELYPGIDDIDVIVEAGSVQVFVTEGTISIPATRLSDGTLRYLCLLAVLLHPEPPPLVCIEEPELGLHPDVISNLGPLLKEASQRMQLIVTTHSDELVDSLSDEPEDVIVCEKIDGSTQMRRLDGPALAAWLEKYTLGELWRRGDLGGNRW